MFIINLDECLVYEVNLTPRLSHFIILAVFLVKLVVYFIVENLIAYKYCKFLFTPWIVYAIFLYDTIMNQTIIKSEKRKYIMFEGHSISNDISFVQANMSFFLHACLLGVLLFLLLAKIFKFVWFEICNQKLNSL